MDCFLSHDDLQSERKDPIISVESTSHSQELPTLTHKTEPDTMFVSQTELEESHDVDEEQTVRTVDSGYTSCISETDKSRDTTSPDKTELRSLSPDKTDSLSTNLDETDKTESSLLNPTPESTSPRPSTPSKTRVRKSPTKSTGGRSPKSLFSANAHAQHISAFKQREAEKKRTLEERRGKQEEELEKKRLAILRKHEAADKRLKEKTRASSPRKPGAFGSTVRSRSTLSLDLEPRKSGSQQNLLSPTVQLRHKSSTPRLRRPVSMGAIPASYNPPTAPVRRSPTPTSIHKGPITQPVIKQNKREEDKRKSIRAKVDMRSLMKPVPPPQSKTTTEQSKPGSKPAARKPSLSRTSSRGTPSPRPPTPTKSAGSPGPTPAAKPAPQRRSSAGKLEPKQASPSAVESPSKSVMNLSSQAKVNQQDQAKLRMEIARKKAREERALRDEEERVRAEERAAEEARLKVEAEEARLRMIRDKELRRKQQEEEAERERELEAQRVEEARLAEQAVEVRSRDEVERQREEQELLAVQRKRAEEERMTKEEEERRERQKKLDAILKRTSVKVDAPPQRKISANASAILAKHNITLNLPSCTNGSNKDLEGPAVENRLIEIPDETLSDQPEIHSPPPADDGDVSANGRNTNNSNISSDLLQLNEGAIHSIESDSLIRIVGDIESEKARHDIPVAKDSDEFTIGIASSPAESQLSHVL